MKILISGANGFIGSAFRQRLKEQAEHQVVSVVRKQSEGLPTPPGTVEVEDLVTESLPAGTMADVDVVVHTAARVHVMSDKARDPLRASRLANVTATLNLARQAAEEGVKRFVFLSTAKVLGEASPPGRPLTEGDSPQPHGAYATSKYEAENRLQELGLRQGMEVVTVRPPLVYGPSVRANFRKMMDWVYRGVPMPLGATRNQRSLLALDNLVDLLNLCLTHPKAADEVFLASDGEDVSTTELLRLLAEAMDRPSRLIPVPPGLLVRLCHLLGKGDVMDRLCGDFQIDSSKAQQRLGWRPPVSLREGLQRTVDDFLTIREQT